MLKEEKSILLQSKFNKKNVLIMKIIQTQTHV